MTTLTRTRAFCVATSLALCASPALLSAQDATPVPGEQALVLLTDEAAPLPDRIETARRIIQGAPQDAVAHAVLGELLMDAGQDGEALAAFRRAVALDETQHSSWHWIGILTKRTGGDLEAAARAFEKSIEQGAPAARGLNELAVTRARQGRMKDALDLWTEAIADDPDWGVLYANAIKAALALGREDLASALFARSLGAERFEEQTALVYGDHLLREGDEDEALVVFRRALGASPRSAKIRYYYGMTLKDDGEEEQAATELSRAAMLAAEQKDFSTASAAEKAHFALTNPREMRRLVKAQELIQEAVSEDGTDYDDLREAIEIMTPIIEEHSNLWEPLLMRGIAFRRLGMFEQSRTDLDAVLALAPDQPNAVLNIGLIARDQGDFETALEWVNRAVDTAPRDPTILINAVLVHSDAGDCYGARRLLNQAEGVLPADMLPQIRADLEALCG